MKFLGANIVALALASTAMATTPNLYHCKAEGIDLSYATSGLTGQATFTLSMGELPQINKIGEQIKTLDSTQGKQVSVLGQLIPDHSSTTYTLILPEVNIDWNSSDGSVKFSTMLIVTTTRSSIGGPFILDGEIVLNDYLPVSCTGMKVQF